MSYRSWLATPHLALSIFRSRAGLARGEARMPRASSVILGLTVAILALALAVECFIRLSAAT